MKKIVILSVISILCVFIGTRSFGEYAPNADREHRKQAFEKRLNLSDKQKEQAKEIHKKGAEQMKPVFYQIELKKQEIFNLKSSDLPEQAKQEKINKIDEEIKNLDQKAREIRKENSKEFENILNKKQKKELEIMKAEGRANFEKNHSPRPPFSYFNNPAFLESRSLFPWYNQPQFNLQKK